MKHSPAPFHFGDGAWKHDLYDSNGMFVAQIGSDKNLDLFLHAPETAERLEKAEEYINFFLSILPDEYPTDEYLAEIHNFLPKNKTPKVEEKSNG